MIAHPFEILPARLQHWLLGLSLVCCALTFGYMLYLDLPLRTAAAPQGIVSYELARTAPRAAAILESWRVPEKPLPGVDPTRPGRLDEIILSNPRMLYLRAFDQLAFDFLFLFSYAMALSLGSLWAARYSREPAVGVMFAWLAWGAAMADALENTMLLRQIGQGPNGQAAATAFACALIKFGIVVGGLLYIAHATWNSPRRPVAVAAVVLVLLLLAPVAQALVS